MGFYHIARAVSFLNNDCGLVRPSSSATAPCVCTVPH